MGYFLRSVYLTFLSFTCAIAGASTLQEKTKSPDRVLVVVSSLDKKTPDLVGGFWFPELTHPVEIFDKNNIEYDIASPKGGMPPFDGFDLKDEANFHFWSSSAHRNKLANSVALSKVDPSKYAAVLLVGGHGPMWDFVSNPDLARIVRVIYEANGIVSAVCHGPAGLLDVRLSNGKSLIDGRRITAFTAEEEAARKYDAIVPFELEGALMKAGAKFEEVPIFQNLVIVDDRIITGQNPASAKSLGDALVRALRR